MADFDYSTAFSRNLGWLTPDEQASLRGKRVAIAGLGGAGGVHVLTLARLGVGAFNLADFDTFDVVNFNRQAGAARDVNPELDLKVFTNGVQPDNLDAFLDGVDLYVDGLDYFVFDARRMMYAACRERGIPITFAVPLGMGASLINFLPGGPSFEDYFRLQGHPESEWPIRFLVGVAPGLLHRHYLAAPEFVDFLTHRVPSTGIACQFCAGMAGATAAKLLLGRGKVKGAPHSIQFDGYTGQFKKYWRPGGNAHPLQRLAIAYVNRRLKRK
jgi:molybdopterin/thiamine biosynthesis adenylyltransferase